MARNLSTVPALEKRVVQIMKAHGVRFIKNRATKAKSKDLKDQGKLINSFSFEVMPAGKRQSTTFTLSFATYGRFVDMKSSSGRWTKMPPVDRIEESLRRRGVGSLTGKRVELEKERGNPGWEDRAFRNAAWAIAKSIQQKGIKRRKWYAKDRWGDINKMYADLIDAYQEWAAEANKAAIKKSADRKSVKARV